MKKNIIKRINYIIIFLAFFGSAVSMIFFKSLKLSFGYFVGSLIFFFLFLHLQCIIKEDFSKTKSLKKVFTYLLRFGLIVVIFYVSIKVSKDFFTFVMIGFVTASLSLTIAGLFDILYIRR